MVEKEGLSLWEPLPGQKRAESAGSPVTVSALATVLERRSELALNAVKDCSSAWPYPPFERRDSIMVACFCHWTVFRCENGRFFVMNF
jgi:hypothetical protein